MAKSKEQQAQDIIASSTALLDNLKTTATKTPNRSRPEGTQQGQKHNQGYAGISPR